MQSPLIMWTAPLGALRVPNEVRGLRNTPNILSLSLFVSFVSDSLTMTLFSSHIHRINLIDMRPIKWH